MPNLQPPFAALADGFGEKVFFLLQCCVDNATFSRVKNAKSERAAVLPDLIGGKSCHRLQF